MNIGKCSVCGRKDVLGIDDRCPNCISDEIRICDWCKKPIKRGEEYNNILGKFTHKKCDDEYFQKQEKNIRVM